MMASLIAIIACIGGIGYLVYIRTNAKHKVTCIEKEIAPVEVRQNNSLQLSDTLEVDEVENSRISECNFCALNQDGVSLIRSKEIDRIPDNARILTSRNLVAVNQAKQLAADIFKGASTLPGKTVELVFDPKIQQGMREGTLNIVPAIGGGSRLMARDVKSKTFSGHGRVIDGGRIKHLAAGVFHIVSIAVAQSHLDEINRSLEKIKESVEDVKRYLSDKDKAKLRGTFTYMKGLVEIMNDLESPELVTPEKRNQLEAIRRETLEWAEQLHCEAVAINEKIGLQKDIDSFGGTENTFIALKLLLNSVGDLVEKRNLLLNIMELLEVGSVYLDPMGYRKTNLVFREEAEKSINTLEAALANMRDRCHILLAKAVWNSESTLEQRRKVIINDQEELLKIARTGQTQYINTFTALENHLNKIKSENNNIKMVLNFDNAGEVSCVALI